ncbi:MAG: mandelate racemase/muconate lactonizing enzyme family protein, partial [Actinomycetota bacterium]|nr:mandelate racemase/muconate lactonizing enzyme family protein [Actinomycetota bacterium]
MRIAAIETRRYRYPLDPPFSAAWDPVPRTHQDATLVIVRSDDGVEGYASGDALPDRELLERLLVGVDAMQPKVVHGICETVDFHHGRNWTLEVAVWDLVGRALDEPLWRHLGGSHDRILAYASSGELVSADERVRRCVALRDAGVRAVKLRLHSNDWRIDLPVIEAAREAVGGDLEIMVDANQGWRMPGDLSPRWDLPTAAAFARELER